MKIYFLQLVLVSFMLIVAMTVVKQFKAKAFHPSPTSAERLPDDYFTDALSSTREKKLCTSALHIQKAISSIRKYKKEAGQTTTEALETSIASLENLRKSLLMGFLDENLINNTFQYSLHALAKAELEFSNTHFIEKGRYEAIEKAKLHIENSIQFVKASADAEKLEKEIQLLRKLNLLSEQHQKSPQQYSSMVNNVIDGIDDVMSVKDN